MHLTSYDVAGGAAGIAPMLARLGGAAEEAGVDALSLMDHFLGPPYLGPHDRPMLEGYTTLAYLAAHTSRVDLLLLVTGVTYRYPGVLAKTVATLDVLSGGRAVLGIGAGWYEREHRALGVPFPPLRDRFELLEETLQVVRQTWSEDNGPFHGRHHRLAETVCVPAPLRRVPVLVGGVGERTALMLVARYADACTVFAGGDQDAEFVAGKLGVLREHCAREGTAYDHIRRTILWTDDLDPGSPAGFLEAMRRMADVGVQEVHVMSGEAPVDFVRRLGDEAIGVLREL